MVYAKNINLFKLFVLGEEIKIMKADMNNFTGKSVKQSITSKKYRVMEVYEHYLKCLNEYGIVECIGKGELVENGLIPEG